METETFSNKQRICRSDCIFPRMTDNEQFNLIFTRISKGHGSIFHGNTAIMETPPFQCLPLRDRERLRRMNGWRCRGRRFMSAIVRTFALKEWAWATRRYPAVCPRNIKWLMTLVDGWKLKIESEAWGSHYDKNVFIPLAKRPKGHSKLVRQTKLWWRTPNRSKGTVFCEGSLGLPDPPALQSISRQLQPKSLVGLG